MEEVRPPKRQRTSIQPAREVGLMRSSPGDSFSNFVGSASGIYFIRSVYGAIRRSGPTNSHLAETPGSDIVPGEEDHLPVIHPNSSQSLWRDGEVTFAPTKAYTFQELIDWSGSYFANWHPFYPFLHAPTLLNQFEKLAQSRVVEDEASDEFHMIVLRSIMSISLADRRQSSGPTGSPYPTALVFTSYDAAVDSLRHILSRPTSLPALQAAMSVQLFLVSMLRLNAASRLGGLILRMAMQIGLHRCPYRFPSFSASEQTLRQRMFWTVYVIDRFICQSMGLPLGIHDDDIDVCYPTSERHIEHPVDLGMPSFLIRLLDLLARQSTIRGEIMELRNKSVHYVQKDPEKATAITAKLSQWWNDVEEYSDRDGEPSVSYSSTILTVLKHESIISLHRPILSASVQGPMYNAALHQCIGSARCIIKTLHNAINKENDATGDGLCMFWPSLTWAVWISTFILFYAVSGAQIAQSTVTRLAGRSLQLLEHFSRRGSVWPEASSVAIRNLLIRMADCPTGTGSQQERDVDSADRNIDQAVTETSATLLFEDLQPTRNNASIFPAPSAPSQLDTRHTEALANDFPNHSEFVPSSLDVRGGGWNDISGFDVFMNQGDYNSLDSFSGFDIPFWCEQDQIWGMTE
ncbi:hypothetical protein T440DRAFT_409262 [Plenodomus tracheiphilus IPT5]|uniref:Xylanolytic transcriptional activator regulatory domain-containing protein n=1 Tax=Plenodomus tracheiphilus IPT5 TaxID=1408161 RepID=A0A6A7ARB2_9PLEO|nr:hypothetical protein T440DRAFT_409262 [Plenodomus tracheiphilus IPT5]